MKKNKMNKMSKQESRKIERVNNKRIMRMIIVRPEDSENEQNNMQ